MASAKGLWIPLEILQRRDLQMYDKIVYALIAYLDQYGGLVTDYLDQWAGHLGCDRGWMEYELQRLARRYLIHRNGTAWKMGPPTHDPRAQLPELPPDVQPLSISNGIAAVYDDQKREVRMYRVTDDVTNGKSH